MHGPTLKQSLILFYYFCFFLAKLNRSNNLRYIPNWRSTNLTGSVRLKSVTASKMWSNRNQLYTVTASTEHCREPSKCVLQFEISFNKPLQIQKKYQLWTHSHLTLEKWNMLRNKLNLVLIFAVSSLSPASARCTKTQVSHCSSRAAGQSQCISCSRGMKHAAWPVGGKL